MNIETDKEQLILRAAEEEFLERGYDGAKTIVIAQKAGVTHAMLHYYFRTKEKLFEIVFLNKVKLITDSFRTILDKDETFEETISSFIHTHFKFIKANPRLINFVYNEVYANKEHREILYRSVFPQIKVTLGKFDKLIQEELEKGTIKPVEPIQLIINIVSINIFTFIFYPIVRDYSLDKSDEFYNRILQEREESNVQFILNSIRK